MKPAITPPHVTPPDRPLSIRQVVRAARGNLLDIIPALAYIQPMLSGRTVARWHMVMDPQGLRRVLLDQVENYPKSDVTKRLLRPAIGDSLFIAEGAHWRWQRRATAPVFQHRHLMALAPHMTQAATRSCARLATAQGDSVDLYQEMVATTFDVICDVALSGRETIDRNAVGQAVTHYMQTIGRTSLLDVLNLPTWIPRPAQILYRSGTAGMQRMVDKLISERADAPRRDDLLSLMLDAHDPETGRRMTPPELRDNLLAFLVAGHETTALALSWALYLLAMDQDVQARVAREVLEAAADAPAGGAHLEHLSYTRQVIEEAMRLYPPAGMLSRTARSNDTLCGREIRRGDTVILPIYALHRHDMWWDDPHRFDPDNFAPEAVKKRHRYLYLPFGGGPRICIGMHFAIIEAQIVLANLIARFHFSPVENHMPRPVMVMTLRPGGGVKLRIRPRKS